MQFFFKVLMTLNLFLHSANKIKKSKYNKESVKNVVPDTHFNIEINLEF